MTSASQNNDFDTYAEPDTGSRSLSYDGLHFKLSRKKVLVPGGDSAVVTPGNSDEVAPTDSAEVTPSAIRANWHALKDVPQFLYGAIFNEAIMAEVRKQEGHPGLSSYSLKIFLSFWKLVAGFASLPVLSVTPRGYVIAEWYFDHDSGLTIMFSSEGRVHYSLFDNGRPCEGYEDDADGYNSLVSMLTSRSTNPFLWSDF